MMTKQSTTLFTGLALAILLSVGCASTQSANTQLSDNAITAKVETKLAADPDINPFNVAVTTNEGVVTLTGEVEKEFAREEAERLAAATEGVIRVQNDISLGNYTMGERVDDGWITTKVKTKFAADPELNPFNINVDTTEGVVTLTGRVETEAAAEEAEELARATKGVKKVNNRLEVG